MHIYERFTVYTQLI